MSDEHMLLGFLHANARPADRMAVGGHAAPSGLALEAAARQWRARVWRIIVRRAIKRAARRLRLWRRRMTESDELRAMPDRELRDIGVNRYEAEYEARKAFWKP